MATSSNRDVRRVVAFIRSQLRPSARGPAALAVVAADDLTIPAACVASLALSCAAQGLRVAVADLCTGAPAARQLGAPGRGAHAARSNSTNVALVVPDADDVAPIGPLGRSGQLLSNGEVGEACRSADVLLTLAALDPAVGGDHLRGWATAAVVTVTAGRASAARLTAIGELIRVAGIAPASAVLLGAEERDDSLGIVPPPDESAPPSPRHRRSVTEEFLTPADGTPTGAISSGP